MSSRRFAAALALGLVVRAATLPLRGHDDVITWKIWSYAAAHDVTSMYGVGGTPPTRGVVTWGELWTTVDYPPLFLYEYAIVGKAYRRLFPTYPDSLALLVAVKLPVLLANIGLTGVLFASVRRVSGRLDRAQWAALAFWLNPATMLGGEMLGYVDSLYMLPAIAALVLACARRPWWAGLLVAVALATKPQAVLVGPAFAFALWQAGGLAAVASAGFTCAVALFAIGLPFLLKGALPNMWLAFGSFTTRRDTMSAYAANLGWIVNWALRSRMGIPELGFPKAFMQLVPRPLSITRFRELGYADPRPFGAAAVLAAVGWAVWTARRRTDLAVAAAVGAFTVHAFFIFSTGVHEGHQLFEVPLLALAASVRTRLRPLFIVVSAIVALNINLLYGAGLGLGWAVPRMATGVDVSVLLAFVNIGVLIWFARAFLREAQEEVL